MTLKRFDALDSVRGLASLVVVINHCLTVFPWFGGSSPGQDVAPPSPIVRLLLQSPLSLVWNGRNAIAVFFVLSGFVLALPWMRNRAPTYRSFVVRRFCRIFLPYAVAVGLAMALVTALAAIRPPPLSTWFDTTNWTEPVTWTAILDHILMLGRHNTYNNVVWSLNQEMRISLMFPLLLLPQLRFGLAGAAVLALALYGAAGVITHFAGWEGIPAEIATTLRFSSFFVLGATLAQQADTLRARSLRFSGLAAWLALGTGLLFLWAGNEPAVKAVGSALVILAAILPGTIQNTLGRSSLRELGRISYSLYLTHLLVILSSIYTLYGRLPLTVIIVGAFVASLFVAWVFNLWIEEPANRLGHRLTSA